MRNMMRTPSYLALALAATACVEARDIRNGLSDEYVYVSKADLTSPNPKLGAELDSGWLFKTTVVRASSPNVVADYAFPGFESDTKYVRFRFKENALQVTDGRQFQNEDPANEDDDLATSTDRVLFEFAGSNLDVKLRESLDGERTNYLEENTELPWQERQSFKVDFAKSNWDPVTNVAWFYGDFLHDCARVMSAHLVPGSYEWDADSQYLAFEVEVTYQLNVLTYFGACYDLISFATNTGSSTIHYKFSFYRPGPSSYVQQEIGEKDEVNKKYGAFQIINPYIDSETGIWSAKAFIQRWDPNRTEPVVFYFIKDFPERFKPMFSEIKSKTNAILESAGAKLRVDFREWNDGGVERKFGDLRYSFVAWHQDIGGTRGLLGYGPSSADPRSGEVISANLNLYNIGLDYYRYIIEAFLAENGARGKPDPSKPWEQQSCRAGETTAPANQSARLQTALFDEMRRVMDLPVTSTTNPTQDFVPTPSRDNFLADYHRTLPEIRYVNPGWNPYVAQPTLRTPLEGYAERLATDQEFMKSMGEILGNQNPFQGASLVARAGIQKQNDFLENFRKWRKNHDKLKAEQEYLLGKHSISTFDAYDAVSAIAKGARRCKGGVWESDAEYSQRIIEDVVFHVAIHEFGHNLALRHNFYGSVDAKHMREGEVSASVMDYVWSPEEALSRRDWGAYDEAALSWIYGSEAKQAEMMRKDFLYCTDEHRSTSALCTAHDLGITPSQIVLNAIERYDWLYSLRNLRAYRKFWDTSFYINSVYNGIFPILRMWYLALFDWGGGGVQDLLKRLDQKNGQVLTDQEYDEISLDFYNDVSRAVELTIAFYDAVINQPASFRNYQTEYDPYYGDVLRIGIIIDKLFTTFAFMDLQEVYDYNPNVYTYVSLYDAPFGSRNYAVSQRVLDNMLGAGYDTFPWFRYLALNIFAAVTNTNLVGSIELKERIAIRRYDRLDDFLAEFGTAEYEEALRPDNGAQVFRHDGEEYVYTYLQDRAWHLVAGRSRNPVSFQFIKEYNELIKAQGSDTEDNFGLKILLAYYEYYNNFQGF